MVAGGGKPSFLQGCGLFWVTQAVVDGAIIPMDTWNTNWTYRVILRKGYEVEWGMGTWQRVWEKLEGTAGGGYDQNILCICMKLINKTN